MKKNTTKRALLMSSLALLLCASMLIGTTFAWFTDSVTSANNIIQTGNLDVELYYQTEGQTDWTKVTESTNVFMEDARWEPGHTEVIKLKIVNEGSLALKYQLGVSVAEETGSVNAYGDDFMLSDHIKYGIVDGNHSYNREDAIAAVEEDAISLNTVYNGQATKLLPKAEGEYEDIVTMVVYMPTTVGNEANHAPDAAAPTIHLGIAVIAMQASFEQDSFDELYDDLAVYEDGAYRVMSDSITKQAAADTKVVIENDNGTFVVTAWVGNGGEVKATIVSAPGKIEDNKAVLSYDIDVTGQVAGSEVAVELYIGKTLMDVQLYHEGVAMSPADYSYDPVSGFVTLKTTSFSVYEVTFTLSDHVITGFDTIVKGEDANHVLGDDIITDNIVHFGPGTTVRLDLNGKNVIAENEGQYSFGAQNGAVLHMTGNGTVNAGKGFYSNKGNAQIIIDGGTYTFTNTGTLDRIKHHSLAQNNSVIVINGGTFISNVEDACLFFATSNGRVEINGGFFENTADKTPDLLSMGTNKGNTNRIVLKGGTFVNWNPLTDKMCYTKEWPAEGEAAFGGPWMLIPGGYTVISETQSNGDIWYSVVPVPAN